MLHKRLRTMWAAVLKEPRTDPVALGWTWKCKKRRAEAGVLEDVMELISLPLCTAQRAGHTVLHEYYNPPNLFACSEPARWRINNSIPGTENKELVFLFNVLTA